MGTQAATTMPKACPAANEPAPVQIPVGDMGRIFDHAMTVQRLLLALHRLAGQGRTGCISAPEELIAWEAFNAAHEVVERLGQFAGYSPEEREPE